MIIYGKGTVGNGIKELLDKLGYEYKIMDDGDYSEEELNNSNTIIITPGIPLHHFLYKKYSHKIIGELQLIKNILKDLNILENFEFIGITGTNGKSTVTWVTYNLFKQLINENTYISGNFETPISKTLFDILNNGKEKQKNTIVMELSSFMLYNIGDFRIDYSIWTNFSTDHLDWHGTIENYFHSKLNIVANTKNTVVENTGYNLAKYTSKNIKITQPTKEEFESNFFGSSNKENLNISYTLLKEYINKNNLNVSDEDIRNTIKTIKPLSQRLEFIKEIDGIQIFNDGKSTSSLSLQAAITSFDEKIILISGGYDKGDDFNGLKKDFENNVSYAALIGNTAKDLSNIMNSVGVENESFNQLYNAINQTIQKAKEKGIKKIIFSPGCASFDMFENVYDRNKHFLNAIEKISIEN